MVQQIKKDAQKAHMRSSERLLFLLLDHIDWLEIGLCKLNRDLLNKGLINFDEYKLINKILADHPTAYFLANQKANKFHNQYYFKPGDKPSRITYLKNLIEYEII